MKNITVSLALAAMALAAQAQNSQAPAPSERVASAAMAHFVDHPYNCQQMLGGGDDGDGLPASYNVALDATLKEIKAPVGQALAQLNARCAQRLSELQGQRSQRVSELTHRN